MTGRRLHRAAANGSFSSHIRALKLEHCPQKPRRMQPPGPISGIGSRHRAPSPEIESALLAVPAENHGHHEPHSRFTWLWLKTNGIPFWDRCTTQFRTYFSGDWDVHWGFGVLTHGHLSTCWLAHSSDGLQRSRPDTQHFALVLYT